MLHYTTQAKPLMDFVQMLYAFKSKYVDDPIRHFDLTNFTGVMELLRLRLFYGGRGHLASRNNLVCSNTFKF